ncbi:MAG: ABC transporter permease [Candidatus Margulisiibacteriota bacterium]
MLKAAAYRLLAAIPLLIGITLVSFCLMKLAPGDPVTQFLDPRSSAQDIAQMRHNLGLDQPIPIQYAKWLGGILKGHFGYSYSTGQPVLTLILDRIGPTLLLSCSALLLIFGLALPVGLWTGAHAGKKADSWVTVLSFIGYSMPTFWLGLMLIVIFSVQFNAFPTSGFMDPGLEDSAWWMQAGNVIWHMGLPLLTIVIGGCAGMIRYTRSSAIRVLGQDYIKAARARGLSEARLLSKHALKNAALPIITILGLELPGLIGGSFVIEYIFSWPGLGQLGIASVFSRDYPVVMATLLFSSILMIVGNLLADLAYQWADPRISD